MMKIWKKMLAGMAAAFLTVGAAAGSAAPAYLVVPTGGRRILASAVTAMYGEALLRDGRPATGTARTGDVFPDGRTVVLPGDVNMDGAVTVGDVVLTARGLQSQEMGALPRAAADVNRSGAVELTDLVAVARMLRPSSLAPMAEIPPFSPDHFRGQVAEMIQEINAYRAGKGLPALTERSDMDMFCQTRAEEQLLHPAWELSHERPDGGGFWTDAPYPPSGEILAHCMTDPATGQYMDAAACAVEQWIHSAAHEQVMVNPTAAYIGGGIAFGKGPDGLWWWKACVQTAHA